MKIKQKQLSEIVKEMDGYVLSLLKSDKPEGLERGYEVAEAYRKLDGLLTPEVMEPIMYLQGKRLGFCTDKDTEPDGKIGTGYDMQVVKRAVIDATLMGLQVYGNHFNILGGRMYPTKEGVTYLLDKNTGLSSYSVIPQTPKVVGLTAFLDVLIEWTTVTGKPGKKTLPLAINVGYGASYDSIRGKAERKGAGWLLGHVTGLKISDGEVADAAPIKETGKVRKQSLRTRKSTTGFKKREDLL